eukprot:COSAG02_NODE_22507_length_750_cov_1.019969_2_plen_83_part_01
MSFQKLLTSTTFSKYLPPRLIILCIVRTAEQYVWYLISRGDLEALTDSDDDETEETRQTSRAAMIRGTKEQRKREVKTHDPRQ